MKKSRKEDKRSLLVNMLKKFADEDMWPLMRLMLPNLDNERSTYGIRESGIADCYVKALGLSKDHTFAKSLKSYKDPTRVQNVRSGVNNLPVMAGDFANVLFEGLENRARDDDEAKVTITQVNCLLDELATTSNSEARNVVYRKFIKDLSRREHFWLTRIILKDMKMGMSPESILKTFHPDAEEIYNTCSNLKEVCELIADPKRMQNEFHGIQPLKPFKPMLSATVSWEKIVAKMGGDPFAIEPKYDGERILGTILAQLRHFFCAHGCPLSCPFSFGVSLSVR